MIRGGEKGISGRACVLATALLLVCAGLPGSASAATISPSTIVDDAVGGNCTLREAIESMNDATLNDACVNTGPAFGTNDTVALVGGLTYSLDLAGSNDDSNLTGDLDPFVDVTITGNAASPPSIENNAVDRVLDTPNPTNLTLEDLTVEDGRVTTVSPSAARVGGNIRYRGQTGNTLLLDNVTVRSGRADSDEPGNYGGGIAANGGGQVTIQNGSSVADNVAGSSSGNFFFGGGIYISGVGTDLTVTNSTVSGNQVGTGVLNTTGGAGGGIFVDASGASIVNITDSVIDNNTAGGDAASPSGSGGGIAAGFNSGASPAVTITGSDITDNVAGGNGFNAEGVGGGIYASQGADDEPLMIDDSLIADNQAGGRLADANGFGGGIFTSFDTTVEDSLVLRNLAGTSTDANNPFGSGGGIGVGQGAFAEESSLTLTRSTINDNKAGELGGEGGGVQMGGDDGLTVTDSAFSGNQVGSTAGTSSGTGGAIRRTSITDETDSITRSVISGNTAASNTFAGGGGIGAALTGSLAIRESTISGNFADGGAGGNGQGGGLRLDGNSDITPTPQQGDFTLENVTVQGNTAQGSGGTNRGGGLIAGNGGGGEPVVTTNHSTFSTNTAVTSIPFPSFGGNLATFGTPGSLPLRASIVTGGVAGSGENCDVVPLSLASQGFNVEGPPSSGAGQCGLASTGDVIADPQLGALLYNGGPTPGAPASTVQLRTMALAATSPAINRVTSPCLAPTTDARGTGFARPEPTGGACDSGAFEIQDGDDDGLLDTADNCPTTANGNQANTDGDAQGDACDPDDDNDGFADATDKCVTQPGIADNVGCPMTGQRAAALKKCKKKKTAKAKKKCRKKAKLLPV